MHDQRIPDALRADVGGLTVATVQAWTGSTACTLQAALRMTNESFAAHLGTAVRTVATWHQKPERVPSSEMQQALDTALERATDGARERFRASATGPATIPAPRTPDPDHAGAARALSVAIAIVTDETKVLLVQRRGEDGGGISWQFPAGMVKPGVSPEIVAVRETLAETGVHCTVSQNLGRRLHPVTHVYCDYLLCDYLSGEAHNVDVVENVAVAWVSTARLTRFIPAANIFPPVLEALEVTE